MIQTVTRTYEDIPGVVTHYIHAYDEIGKLIDIIEMDERNGRVILCRSILDIV